MLVSYPDDAAFGDLTSLARIIEALDQFNEFVGSDPAGRRSLEWREKLRVSMPDQGEGLESVLKELCETVIPNGLRNGHPGFSGWVTTSPTTSGTAATLASTVAGSQRFWVQAFNLLEEVSLDWLKRLLGFPSTWQGTYCTGGSSANLIALGAARQWAVEQQGVDPAMTGMPDGMKWRIYASSEVHHVVNRAAAVLGIGRRSVVPIPVNSRRELDLGALESRLRADREEGWLPMSLVATAGTVNTGAIDPIRGMLDLAKEFGTWLHVDGAYGMFGVLDSRVAELYDGVAEADSVALDPHKWLAAPVGNGVAMVRDRALLGRAFTLEPASYLEGSADSAEQHIVQSPFDDFGVPYHDFNLDQSAPSRGVQVWAILKEIGRKGMIERVVRHNSFARRLEEVVRDSPQLEVLSPAVLSICCFRFIVDGQDDESLNSLNRRIASALRAEGTYVPSTTMLEGRFAIRPCYINPRARLDDVEGLASRVIEIGNNLLASN